MNCLISTLEIFTEEFNPFCNEVDYILLWIGEVRKTIYYDKLKIVFLGTIKWRAILSKEKVQLIELQLIYLFLNLNLYY